MRFLVGSIADWTALFKEAYSSCQPGGYVESFEVSPHLESDDGTVTEKSAMGQWGKFYVEGGRKFNRTFTVFQEGIQKKAMEEAGFVDIEVKDIKASLSFLSLSSLSLSLSLSLSITLSLNKYIYLYQKKKK